MLGTGYEINHRCKLIRCVLAPLATKHNGRH